MLPHGLIVPTLQRVEDALEDLDAIRWELDQIAGNPELSWHLEPEAERKVMQAKNVLSLVLPLVQEILVPFAEEQAALKCDQEAVLQAPHNVCTGGQGKECLPSRTASPFRWSLS